jgi:hypothetical protein
VIHPVGERQWEDVNWNGQGHRAGDLLSVAVPRYGSRAWTMRGCTLVDPLGAQAVCRLGLLS